MRAVIGPLGNVTVVQLILVNLTAAQRLSTKTPTWPLFVNNVP